MRVRGLVVTLLGVLAMLAGTVPAAAGTPGKGLAHFVRFLHAHEAVERIALRDVDNDGDLDVLAAARGGLVLWRNAGDGRFALASVPRTARRLAVRVPRMAAAGPADNDVLWGVDRSDAVVAGGCSTVHVVAPVVLVRVSAASLIRPVSLRRSCGRAPPVLA